jgi:hypothetical protein
MDIVDFCTSSLPMTRMNVASVRFATALAHNVFPVPGGPYNMTPFGGSIPRLTNRSGYKRQFPTNQSLYREKGNLDDFS